MKPANPPQPPTEAIPLKRRAIRGRHRGRDHLSAVGQPDPVAVYDALLEKVEWELADRKHPPGPYDAIGFNIDDGVVRTGAVTALATDCDVVMSLARFDQAPRGQWRGIAVASAARELGTFVRWQIPWEWTGSPAEQIAKRIEFEASLSDAEHERHTERLEGRFRPRVLEGGDEPS